MTTSVDLVRSMAVQMCDGPWCGTILRGGRTVADVVDFGDGAVVRWRGEVRSVAVYPSIDDAVKVHGHEGTEFRWINRPSKAYARGVADAAQDACESAFVSIGGLDALAAAELQQAHGRLRTIHRTRAGRQLHVGSVVPSGWRDVDLRRMPVGRPRTAVGSMTGAELQGIHEQAAMSLREFARALSVSPSTVLRYESGERAIPEDVARAALLLAPSVPETPSQNTSYLGVSGTPSVQCSATGGFGNTQAAIPLRGVSGTLRARRIDLSALLGAQGEPSA